MTNSSRDLSLLHTLPNAVRCTVEFRCLGDCTEVLIQSERSVTELFGLRIEIELQFLLVRQVGGGHKLVDVIL